MNLVKYIKNKRRKVLPSLHSARSTFLLLFFIYLTKFNLLFGFFASVIVLIVLYSRVHFKKHYVIDVIVGVILAVVCYYMTIGLIELLFVF